MHMMRHAIESLHFDWHIVPAVESVNDLRVKGKPGAACRDCFIAVAMARQATAIL